MPFSNTKIDAAVINAVLNGKRPENPFYVGNIGEERLWRLLQVCWHQSIKVRPSMEVVQVVMDALAREVGVLVGSLPQGML